MMPTYLRRLQDLNCGLDVSFRQTCEALGFRTEDRGGVIYHADGRVIDRKPGQSRAAVIAGADAIKKDAS